MSNQRIQMTKEAYLLLPGACLPVKIRVRMKSVNKVVKFSVLIFISFQGEGATWAGFISKSSLARGPDED